jgi:1-aminocyclopropane-1-carboxylate deaminase/D-cysteine desulfhydrase-like pyridoxal-dependent ACC family enzyme
MLFNISNTSTDILQDELLLQKNITLAVLRLDKIHPVVSGNKLFKLHYFLQEATAAEHKTILTFGGAYSNHLVATAYACKAAGLKSIGIIRGEEPAQLSLTLQHCINYGMQVKYFSREAYNKKEDPGFIEALLQELGPCTIIPEGGYSEDGAKGAALIWKLIAPDTWTHIATASGTATTLAGILLGANTETIISVPVLKGMTDIEARITFCGAEKKLSQLQIADGYHFGGYAKKTPELLAFMNTIWQQQQVPTDFVYTAKMLYAIFDRIKNDHFAAGSKILCLNTGGLQGNLSLPENSLLY